MTAPNLLNITSVVAHTATTNVSPITSTSVSNTSGSNTVAKVEDLILVNYTGITQAANVFLNRTVQTPGIYFIAANISVPAYSTLALLGKDTTIYVEEGDSLQANSATTMNMIVGYQIIST